MLVSSNLRELKIGVVLSYLQMVANIVIALVYTPVMLTMLGKSEYGIYSIAASVISYVQLLEFGLAQSYVKFFTEARASEDKLALGKTNGLFILCFSVLSIFALAAGIVLTIYSKEIFASGLTITEHQLIKKIMFVLAISTAFNLATTIYSSIVIAHEHFIVHRLIGLIRTVIQPTIIWMLLILGYRSFMMACVTSVLTVLVGLFYLSYCLFKIRIPISFHNLSIVQLRAIFVFSFFVVLNFIFNQATWSMDKIILGRLAGAASVAVYTVGVQFAQLYIMMSTAISSVFVPRVNNYVAGKQPIDVLSKLFIKIGRIQTILILPILLGFVFYGQQFIELWAPNGYEDAYWVAVITMVPLFVALIQNTGIAIQMAQNKHRFRSIVYTSLAVVHLFLSILICEQYGAIGGAIGTALYLVLGPGLVMNWYYQKNIGLDILGFWKSISSFLPTTFVCGVVGYAVMQYVTIDTWRSFTIWSMGFGAVYVVMVWFTSMNSDEKGLFLGVVRRFR